MANDTPKLIKNFLVAGPATAEQITAAVDRPEKTVRRRLQEGFKAGIYTRNKTDGKLVWGLPVTQAA